MNIFVAGATGRVAEFVISNLVEQGYTVTAGARSIEKVKIVNSAIYPTHLDLHSDVPQLTEIIKGHDAIYFLAGSRGKDLLQTDAFGAVKLMQAAEKAGIKRFILLSSVFATEPEKWNDPQLVNITNYNIAKFFADHWLIQNTTLDYTILQPGNLVESNTGSGKITVGVESSQPNTIPNVAKVLVEILNHPNTIHKIIQMSDGDTEISKALSTI